MITKFENNGFISIDGKIYNPAFMRCQFVNMGQYQEVNLWHNNAVIFTASNDPNSPHKNNQLFEEADLLKGANKAINKMAVIGNFNLQANSYQQQNSSFTKIVSQAGHGLKAPSVAYVDPVDGRYKPSDRNDLTKIGTILILKIIDLDNFEVATTSSVYNVSPTNAIANETVYLGATPGEMTCTLPPVNTLKVRLGEMHRVNEFFWNPDKEQEWTN